MLGKRIERYYPWLFSLAGLVFLPSLPWVRAHRLIMAVAIAKLFAPALNVSAIAIGFLATSQSILISLRDSSGIAMMKRDGYYDTFVDFLSSATTSSFGLAVVSGLFAALDFNKVDSIHGWMEAIWISFCCGTLASYYRAVTLLPFVLRGSLERRPLHSDPVTPFDPDDK